MPQTLFDFEGSEEEKDSRADKPEVTDKGEESEKRMLSASQINMFRNCRRSWFYKYILKLPEVETIYQAKGKAVHTVCERFFDYKPPGGLSFTQLKKELADRAQVLFDQAWKETEISEKFGDETYNDSWEIVTRFLMLRNWEMEVIYNRYGEAQKAWNWSKPKFRELHILDKDLMVEGYIDSVIERDGETILVDYKTGSIYKFSMKDDYKLQLSIYALLYQAKTGIVPDYVALEYLQYGKIATIPVHPVFLEEATKVIEYTREKMKSTEMKDHRREKGNLCRFCSFQDQCEKDG